jgi:hypothetical protein
MSSPKADSTSLNKGGGFKAFILLTAWAPSVVLIFHRAIAHTPLRKPLDFTVHSMGGAAMAYCAWQGIRCFPSLFGRITAFAATAFSFCFAVTVGVFWEFIEQISDKFYGTHIQLSISETMKDLWADATGATLALLLIMVVRRVGG